MNRIMTANFHGTALYGEKIGDFVFVAPKPIVEAMGLAWQGQLERIKRHHVLREGISVMLMPTPSGPQNTVGLRLNLIPGWLFTISTLRIKDPVVRAKLELFQRECFDLLWERFSGEHKTEPLSAEYERRSLNLVEEVRLTFGHRAAAQVYRLRGLPRVPAMDEMFQQIDMFDKAA